jgi:hypothetical protein
LSRGTGWSDNGYGLLPYRYVEGGSGWDGKKTHTEAINFYPIFIPILSVRFQVFRPRRIVDMPLRLPFLTPEHLYETTPKWHGFLDD